MKTNKKGAKYHFFLWWLEPYVRQNYHIRYRYKSKSYCLTRKSTSRNLLDGDVFIVTNTSAKCYRLSHYDYISNEAVYKSFRSPTECADWVSAFAPQHDKLDILDYSRDNDICTSINIETAWLSAEQIQTIKKRRIINNDNETRMPMCGKRREEIRK